MRSLIFFALPKFFKNLTLRLAAALAVAAPEFLFTFVLAWEVKVCKDVGGELFEATAVGEVADEGVLEGGRETDELEEKLRRRSAWRGRRRRKRGDSIIACLGRWEVLQLLYSTVFRRRWIENRK